VESESERERERERERADHYAFTLFMTDVAAVSSPVIDPLDRGKHRQVAC
jgi:hypothetical protein